MSQELISVIIPVYNVEQYLAECVQCLSSDLSKSGNYSSQ